MSQIMRSGTAGLVAGLLAAGAAPGLEGPVVVPRAASSVVLDGRLDEAAWSGAAVIPLVYETSPGENVEPPVATRCLVTHDDERLYVAFDAYDPAPERVRARLTDRDAAFDDDFVGIVLDTFNDERRAFEFFVNPLGVQMDLFFDDVAGTEDSSWDAIWDAEGRITERGFQVEMAIPFHQLRFAASQGPKVWGFDALRFYPREHRYRISAHPLDRDVECYLCQASKMRGFAAITPGRNLEVVPTLTGQRTDLAAEPPRAGLEQGDAEADPGVTVTWGPTPNLIVNATANPDFSQVEADVAQLAVNERFALFFPEKRPFFLEGADFFDTPIDAVFTRVVAAPEWGLKLTGKVGRNALGVFAAEDDVTNLLLPGSQGSRATTLAGTSRDAVLRYRRDLGRSSALGVLFTGREGEGYSSGLAGVDGLWRIGERDSVSFQYLASESEYPAELARDAGLPEGTLSDDALWVEYVHDSRDWRWRILWEDLGPEFRADLGFLPQVDVRLWLAGLQRTWWGGEDDWWNRIELGGDVDRTEEHSGQLLEEEKQLWLELSGPRESFFFVEAGTRDRFFEGVTFGGESFWGTYFEVQATPDFYCELWVGGGDEIDFANTRPGEVLWIEPALRWNLGRRALARLSYTRQRLDVEGGELFEAHLGELRLEYQLDRRTRLRLITQGRRVSRDPELYLDPVEAEAEELFNQLLFSYEVNPQTVLYLGYSDLLEGAIDERGRGVAVDLERTSRTFFFKLGWAWVP